MTKTEKPKLPQHDPEFLRKIGAKGGKATKRKRGKNYYSRLAKKSHPKNNPEARRKTYNGGRHPKQA